MQHTKPTAPAATNRAIDSMLADPKLGACVQRMIDGTPRKRLARHIATQAQRATRNPPVLTGTIGGSR